MCSHSYSPYTAHPLYITFTNSARSHALISALNDLTSRKTSSLCRIIFQIVTSSWAMSLRLLHAVSAGAGVQPSSRLYHYPQRFSDGCNRVSVDQQLAGIPPANQMSNSGFSVVRETLWIMTVIRFVRNTEGEEGLVTGGVFMVPSRNNADESSSLCVAELSHNSR